MMKRCLASLSLLGSLLHVWAQCSVPFTESQPQGDYVIGGLFDIHHGDVSARDRPESTDCYRKSFILSSYRRSQVMSFSVEEINNSTELLPNISLGYKIFDHCTDTENFPGILSLISDNGVIQPNEPQTFRNRMIAAVGTYTSTETRTVAPLFMMDLVPMVSYGAASSVFSRKQNFPSFLRTVQTNKDVIAVIVNIVQHFKWRWVAFLHIADDYGNDGLKLFIEKIKHTEICLAYNKGLTNSTSYGPILRQIEKQRIGVIIVFAAEWTAESLITAAIKHNSSKKVWIAGDAWSLNTELPRRTGIRNIGTVLGVSEPRLTIPGFNDFIRSSHNQNHCENEEQKQQQTCNQSCNCTAEDVINADPSFNFPVYSAVYAIAHALHNSLQCGAGRCNNHITVYPHMVLAELKKSNFTLLNHSVGFDENGDPKYGTYSIVFWSDSGDAEEVGFYEFHSPHKFFINESRIQWYTDGKVPVSVCSEECQTGYKKNYLGIHKCCFSCTKCGAGTYVNFSDDPYQCFSCKETEWSEPGSTSCSLRLIEYIPFTDTGAILTMAGTLVLVGLTLAMSVLFAINYNTPVVRSAGGPMCFLILGCLSLSSISVFFYFGKPTMSLCILRFLPFLLFYTVCLACFVVRSFQIVYIFRIAAKFPNLHTWWMKYHGQWLIITVAFLIQALLLLIGYTVAPPKPYSNMDEYPDKIIAHCDIGLKANTGSMVLLLSLCSLCFIFSYMGKDLPKNYNEAKAITFCLLLLILTWITFATVHILYRGKFIQIVNALAVLFSLYSFLLFYFLPKCYIIIFQSYKNTQQYFQGLIQNYTKTISQ